MGHGAFALCHDLPAVAGGGYGLGLGVRTAGASVRLGSGLGTGRCLGGGPGTPGMGIVDRSGGVCVSATGAFVGRLGTGTVPIYGALGDVVMGIVLGTGCVGVAA